MYSDHRGGAQVGKSVGALAGKGRASLKELAAHALHAESPEAEAREDGEDTGAPNQDTNLNTPCCCCGLQLYSPFFPAAPWRTWLTGTA